MQYSVKRLEIQRQVRKLRIRTKTGQLSEGEHSEIMAQLNYPFLYGWNASLRVEH